MTDSRRQPWAFYQLKIALIYMAIILVMLALLNTYPVLVSQDIVFENKKQELVNRANGISSALSGVDTLDGTAVAWAMKSLDLSTENRIVITDGGARVLYDNSTADTNVDKRLLLGEVVEALGGKDVFYSRYRDGQFRSYAVVPVLVRGQVAGTVYLYEADSRQGDLLSSLQFNLLSVSLLILVVVLLVSAAVTTLLARRLGRLLHSVQKVHQGEYGHHTKVKGNDELTQLEMSLNELSDRLLQTESSRRQFVADASHELRTPLASMRLMADSILENEGISVETSREFVDDIRNETARLSRMADKLLTLTKLDAQPVSQLEPVRLADAALRAVRMLTPLAKVKDIAICAELDEHCTVSADSDGCYQIIFNLVENAIKYSPAGQPVLVTLNRDGDSVVLRVRDQGNGIPVEEQQRIFDRFYRVDKMRAREAGGAGLGLAIVGAAVQQFNGHIDVESAPGAGCCFIVTFPAAE